MIETPRTDNYDWSFHLLFAEAQKMERELNAANERIHRMESFINRFLDPEDLGYAVHKWVRDDAREALGRERVESKP